MWGFFLTPQILVDFSKFDTRDKCCVTLDENLSSQECDVICGAKSTRMPATPAAPSLSKSILLSFKENMFGKNCQKTVSRKIFEKTKFQNPKKVSQKKRQIVYINRYR